MYKIVRYANFTTTPWKNGGGITREAMRKAPSGAAPGSSDFLWRVSVAQVDASGPFSDFSGYRRSMVLLQGDGVRLSFSDRSVTELREIGNLVTFDGALSADCQLLDGPCVDLNLMVAAAVTVVDASVERIVAPLSIELGEATTLLIFGIEGALAIEQPGAPSAVLERWDVAALTLAAGEAAVPALLLTPQDAATGAQVFIAKLID